MNLHNLQLDTENVDVETEVVVASSFGISPVKDIMVVSRKTIHNNFNHIPLEGSEYILLLSSDNINFALTSSHPSLFS